MKPTLKNLALVVAVVALAIVGFRMLDQGDRPAPLPQADEQPERPSGGDPQVATADAQRVDPTRRDEPTRERVDVSTGSGAELPQGVHGRVVDTGGAPVEDARVFLMESAAPDIFSQMMLAHHGVTLPPVAVTTTDATGRFSLGVRKPAADKSYEIRAIHDRLADANVPGIRLQYDAWIDAGDVRMPDGTTVFGRVTVAGGSGLPIANATVYAQTLQGVTGLNPTPGREQGIKTTTDANGNFRFDNVTAGIVTMSAVAPGFAKSLSPHVPVTGKENVEQNFELSPGKSIGGIVTDPSGTPIARAVVKATAISTTDIVAEEARTGPDGRFEILGVVDGPYVVRADASGFVSAEVKPVQAGTTDQRIVLERKCVARVRVETKDGRLVRTYHLSIKRYFEGQEQFGPVYGSPNVHVSPSDLGPNGEFEFGGLDPGGYVFEIVANGYAKTYSAPFAVLVGTEPPLVEVALNDGGRIVGQLLDPDGAPIGGAVVETFPDFFDENPIAAMFGPMVPAKITRTSTRTDAEGRYALDKLAPGSYQLKFSHPDFCALNLKGNVVTDARQTDMAPIRLQHGTVISGIVDVDGTPSAHVKVSITSVPDPTGQSAQIITAEAFTDTSGRYQINKRLPPGEYSANATRQTIGNPLLQVIDSARTQRGFDLAPGQQTLTLNFSISSKAN